FQPRPELMVDVPLLFQAHVFTALLLFALWPFTRLVHVFSAPVGYLVRPYIVYRSRDEQQGTRAVKRGWDPVEQPDPERLKRL
ncbi:MAG TPA: respiratory nitrate reductase subunit gamma, partial [Microbacteriaceae bacterium]|nr:respiratory nitrate reductase subunit gamma [Microbacteriaceae bacterium]